MQDPSVLEIADLPMVINSVTYPTLSETFRQIEERLLQAPGGMMVLEHGDVHYGNIFRSEKDGYQIIDPIIGGYNYPEASINTTLIYPDLFVYDYDTQLDVGQERIKIDYQTSEIYQRCEKTIKTLEPELTGRLTEVQQNTGYLNEFMFINLARSFVGLVNPMNLEKTQQNRYAHLARAVERYYKSV